MSQAERENPDTARKSRLRAQLKQAGIKKRELYLTDEEWVLVKAYAEYVRKERKRNA